MELSRRGALSGFAAGALSWATLSGRAVRAATTTSDPWAALPTGADGPALPLLRQRIAADGVAEVVIVAAPVEPGHPLAGLVTAGYADGIAGTPPTVPGPTLALTPGVRTRVTLVNHLDQETSLHLHGLRLSPAVDAPLAAVAPGASRTYDVTVPVMQTGTCWYHPHVHGLVSEQMAAGLTGGLVLQPAVLPGPLAGIPDRLLVLTALSDARHVLVDGQRAPHVDLPSGRVRLRLVNTSVSRTLTLTVTDGSSALTLLQVATDGGWLREGRPATTIALAPGERAEVVVDVPDRTCALVALPRANSSDGGEAAVLATLSGADVTAAPVTGALRELKRLLPGPRTRVRRINLGESDDDSTFTIDGRPFDHRRVDVRVRRGSTEVWEIRNTTGLEHPFHLHSYPFQVLSRNGGKERLVADRDVTLVAPYERIRILIPFVGYSGLTVFHCHNTAHEDAGMMATVLVH